MERYFVKLNCFEGLSFSKKSFKKAFKIKNLSNLGHWPNRREGGARD